MEAQMNKIMPGRDKRPSSYPYVREDTYKTLPYVQDQCAKLAQQLKEIADGNQDPHD